MEVDLGGHYFRYQGKPILLLCSDHHYGAIVDTQFDYAAFLNYLGSAGMNVTRIYPGAMFEPDGKYYEKNPLGPAPGRQILPWVQTTHTGASRHLGGYKYDLDHWNQAYFARLRDFVATARKNGVIVDVAFFNGMYDDCWPNMALYHTNNIQGVGTCTWQQVQSVPEAGEDLLQRQKDYVKEITRQLNDFDNVIFEIADEPWTSGASGSKWVQGLIDAFHSVDGTPEYPNKHLLGQTVGKALGGEEANQQANTLVDDPRVNWLPSEYVCPTLYSLDNFTRCNKPIMCIESMYWPNWYLGDNDRKVDAVRIEEWEQVIGGAAGHITLNADFTRSNPTAKPPCQFKDDDLTRNKLVPQKKLLKDFIYGFDFTAMIRNTSFSVTPADTSARGIAQNGRQYALYLHHSKLPNKDWCSGYDLKMGSYKDTVTLREVPVGDYRVEWIAPQSGAILQSKEISQSEPGDITVTTPVYSVDIALRMKRIGVESR